MAKKLVAYFSVSGVTAQVAQEIAKVEGADCFEIRPEAPYTKADLDWTNKQSRSTLEMADLNCRPAVTGCVENMAQYDAVFVGFPIWWGREPSVVDTFLTAYDFGGKKCWLCRNRDHNRDGRICFYYRMVHSFVAFCCGLNIFVDRGNVI